MDLPTYTNIWRIEKRLYKLYDFRLPMPLPLGQIAVFTAIVVPYVVVLAILGVPFSHTLLWLYVLPPGVLTWLATRPVIESKRLPELVASQLRYLSEPRTWCRMAPLVEKDEVFVAARIWRREGLVNADAEDREVSRPTGRDSRQEQDDGEVTSRRRASPSALPAIGPSGNGVRGRTAIDGPERVAAATAVLAGPSGNGRRTPAVSGSHPQADGRAAAWRRAVPQGRRKPPDSPVTRPAEAAERPDGRGPHAPARPHAPVWPQAPARQQAPARRQDRGSAGAVPPPTVPARQDPAQSLPPAAAAPRPAARPHAPVWPQAPARKPPVAGPLPPRAVPLVPSAVPLVPPAVPLVPPAVPLVPPAAATRQDPAQSRPSDAAGSAPAAAPPQAPAPRIRPSVTVNEDRSAERPLRMVERALGSPAERRPDGWRDRVVVVPGGHRPGQPDQSQRDRARARLPITGARRVVVLGCTVGAGQSVTTLRTGEMLASLRDEPVAVLDLNPGRNSLSERARMLPGLAGLTAQPGPAGFSQAPAPSRLEVITSQAQDVPAPDAAPGAPGTAADAAQIFEVLAARYALTLADPAASAVPRVLSVADQLLLVAPASSEAASAIAMTMEWLEAHGHGRLAESSITVLNGVSKHTMAHVEQAEAMAVGRCRAVIRVPWDDQLRTLATQRPRNEAPAGHAHSAASSPASAAAERAYTALAGALVASLVAAPELRRAGS